MKKQLVVPPNFPKPRGYSNGVLCGPGRVLYIAGQVAFDKDARIVSPDFATQFLAALDNVVAVVRAAGGATEHIVKLLCFVTDLDKYRAAQHAIGEGWRARMGSYWPAMSLVKVAGLLEAGCAGRDRGHRDAPARGRSMRAAARSPSHAREGGSGRIDRRQPLGAPAGVAQPDAGRAAPPPRGGLHPAALRSAGQPRARGRPDARRPEPPNARHGGQPHGPGGSRRAGRRRGAPPRSGRPAPVTRVPDVARARSRCGGSSPLTRSTSRSCSRTLDATERRELRRLLGKLRDSLVARQARERR